MFIYVLLEALVGIVLGILIAVRTKKAEGVTYGKLDKVGRITNVILTVLYAVTAPFYMLLGMFCEPDGEGRLIVPAVIVCLIAASAALFSSLGLGFSVALRKKGKSTLSFLVQLAGVASIVLTVALYAIFVGTLLAPLN